ncbi:MAG: phosphoribosylanthranilate isomerase [Candidatus Longimicrobiales bacterium M2_2A_002]
MTEARRPAVKICGVCDPVDAAMAVQAGATHIGVIRVPGSRRTRPADVVRDVCEAAAGARRVGVYVDATVATILRETESLGLDVVQLHGAEPADVIDALSVRGLEVWKVVKPVRAGELLEAADRYRAADLILAEGRSDQGHGGVGARLPWDEVAGAVADLPNGTRLGVGGGLTPGNVGAAVRRFRPVLVDVSSGVESEPCRKDPAVVRAFVAAAREAGREVWGEETE